MKKSEKKLISRGLDGALSPEERVRLETLRETNPEVRATERAWSAIGDQVRRVPVQPPDAAVAWQDIRRAIRTAGEQSAGEAAPAAWFGRLRWAVALSAFAVLALLGVSAWRLMEGAAVTWSATPDPADRVAWVVAEIPGATTMIYTDKETDMTVIWMDVAQNVDPRDT